MATVYKTVAGDTFDIIAYQQYGDETKADKIMEANPELLDYFVFPANVSVVIPELDTTESTVPMPPWMTD